MTEDEHDWKTIVCSHCGWSRRIPVRCGNRLCPVCNQHARLRTRRRITWLLANVKHRAGYGTKHITLTIPNQTFINPMLHTLVASFRKLRHTQFWKTHVDGGAYVLEITGKAGSWHLHIHTVVSARLTPWQKLLNLWQELSPGRGVWITRIPDKQAAGYLTKYLTKADVPDDDVEEAGNALKGQRMFQPYGTWHSVNATYHIDPPCCPDCGRTGTLMLMTTLMATPDRAWERSRASPIRSTA